MLDELMRSLGLKFENLKPHEQEEYISMLNILEQRALTVDDFRSHIKKMREAVELELVDTDEFVYIFFFRFVNRKHVGLKARLKNYVLLEAYFESHEQAKKALEKQLETRISNLRK
jgi:hypothetical protein